MKENSIIYKAIDPMKITVSEGFNQRVDFGDIDELAAQIKEQGLLEAISVIPYIKDGEERYLLINGERRYRALMKLINDGVDVGLVKANLLPADLSEEEMLAQQFMRNEGKRFNDVELGLICKKILECKKPDGTAYNRSDVAKMLGKNPGVITYALQMLDYDPRIVDMVKKGEIGGSEVRRIYTAARKKYGDDWESKGNEQILKMHEEAVAATETTEEPVKVSIKDNDLYGDVKDTKAFLAGMKIFFNYLTHYEKRSKEELEIDIVEYYARLNADSTLTLRELFEEAIKAAQSPSEAL
jgi:ParB family chromosome partitioning protein